MGRFLSVLAARVAPRTDTIETKGTLPEWPPELFGL